MRLILSRRLSNVAGKKGGNAAPATAPPAPSPSPSAAVAGAAGSAGAAGARKYDMLGIVVFSSISLGAVGLGTWQMQRWVGGRVEGSLNEGRRKLKRR